MASTVLREATSKVVRDRVLQTLGELIAAGQPVTFSSLSAASDVPERTLYRHFPNRQALIGALFEHVNRRIGFAGDPPRSHAAMVQMVQQVFPGFDTMAPIVDELLSTEEGRRARLAAVDERRAAAIAVVADARPDLDPDRSRRIAAVIQVLGTASVWRALRDFWDMDGSEAATAVTTTIDALLATHHERT
jgi:AcrR family transcriptional regulator